MKRTKTVSIIALLGASLLAAPAVAQVGVGGEGGVGVGIGGLGVEAGGSGSANAGAGVGVNAGGAKIDSGTTASVGTNFNGALSAMGRNSQSAASIGTMSEVSSVNVVRVGELDGASEAELETAANAHSDGIRKLRAAIDANAALKSALEAENVDTSSVVAADMSADGSLTVFVE